MLSVFSNDEYEWMPIKAALTLPQWAINIIKDATGISTAMQCGLTAIYNSKLLKEDRPLERLSADGGSTRGDQLAVTHWDPSDPWWAEKSNSTLTEEWNKYVLEKGQKFSMHDNIFGENLCNASEAHPSVVSQCYESPNLTCDREICWVNKFTQKLPKRNGKNNKNFSFLFFHFLRYVKKK